MHILDVIRGHLAGKVSGNTLIRAVMDTEWHIETTFGQGEFQVAEHLTPEGRWSELYSSRERCPAQTTTTVAGAWYFRTLFWQVVGVTLEKDHPEAIHWRKDQMDLLRRWGKAVHIERVLLGTAGDDVFAQDHLFRSFDGWSVVTTLGAGAQMVLAPDDQGRHLAAICTAPDCLEAFVERYVRKLGVPFGTAELSSATLYTTLRAMPIDGIVFNPLGPIPAKAVKPAFAEMMKPA